MFFIELSWLALFGWYFATEHGVRKRLIAMVLTVTAITFSVWLAYPPGKKSHSVSTSKAARRSSSA